MTIRLHGEIPFHTVPRVRTRVLAGHDCGATESAVWEQWIEPDGHIPLHYHDVEEVLVFLEGSISLTLSNETTVVTAPATVIVPARVVHGVRPEGTRIHLLAFFPTASPSILAPDGTPRPLPWDDQHGV